MKTGIYCYLNADILTKPLQKSSWSDPLQNTPFLLKPLNLVGYYGHQKAKFVEKYSQINSSEAAWVIKLKFCRIVSNISPYKNGQFGFIAVAEVLWLLWQLKVSIDLQW